MEFSRQEYWSGLPCPPPADLPDPGIKPASLELLFWTRYSCGLVRGGNVKLRCPVSSESRHLSGANRCVPLTTKERAGMEILVGRSGAGLTDGSVVKNLPAKQKTQETQVPSPGRDYSHGGGNGNPLQCSCPENPMDRGALWATVQGVAKSQTRLSTPWTRPWSWTKGNQDFWPRGSVEGPQLPGAGETHTVGSRKAVRIRASHSLALLQAAEFSSPSETF